jgi:hypothetical protein
MAARGSAAVTVTDEGTMTSVKFGLHEFDNYWTAI